MIITAIKCYCTHVPVLLFDRYYLLTNSYCTVLTLSPLSPPVLGLGHVLALRVEAPIRVRGVVDHLQLAVLVVVAVAAVHHPVGVPLLVPKLPVVPGTETRYKIQVTCHPDNLRSCRKSGQMSRGTQCAGSWPGPDK